jgi:hypothetical protein
VRFAAALAILGVACARGDEGARSDSASPSSATPAAAAPRADSTATAAVPAGPSCVSEGDWQQCSIEKRLTDAGYVPVNKGPAPAGIFDIPGTTYLLGKAELNVYIFRSARDREAAVAKIDTNTVAPRGGTAPWSMPPWFITSNNLVAVLVSDNGRLIERVQNAVRAGLPSKTR